jgi:phage terminase Nu1 subunit (DNA packaging protein)
MSDSLKEDSDLVSVSELAGWLDCSTKSVTAYAAEGVVVRAGRGRYRLRQSIAGYIRSLRSSASGRSTTATDERTRLLRAQADSVEHKLAVTRGEFLPAAEVEMTWSDALRRVRTAMFTVPSRLGAKLSHLTAHDLNTVYEVVRDVLEETALKEGAEE